MGFNLFDFLSPADKAKLEAVRGELPKNEVQRTVDKLANPEVTISDRAKVFEESGRLPGLNAAESADAFKGEAAAKELAQKLVDAKSVKPDVKPATAQSLFDVFSKQIAQDTVDTQAKPGKSAAESAKILEKAPEKVAADYKDLFRKQVAQDTVDAQAKGPRSAAESAKVLEKAPETTPADYKRLFGKQIAQDIVDSQAKGGKSAAESAKVFEKILEAASAAEAKTPANAKAINSAIAKQAKTNPVAAASMAAEAYFAPIVTGYGLGKGFVEAADALSGGGYSDTVGKPGSDLAAFVHGHDKTPDISPDSLKGRRKHRAEWTESNLIPGDEIDFDQIAEEQKRQEYMKKLAPVAATSDKPMSSLSPWEMFTSLVPNIEPKIVGPAVPTEVTVGAPPEAPVPALADAAVPPSSVTIGALPPGAEAERAVAGASPEAAKKAAAGAGSGAGGSAGQAAAAADGPTKNPFFEQMQAQRDAMQGALQAANTNQLFAGLSRAAGLLGHSIAGAPGKIDEAGYKALADNADAPVKAVQDRQAAELKDLEARKQSAGVQDLMESMDPNSTKSKIARDFAKSQGHPVPADATYMQVEKMLDRYEKENLRRLQLAALEQRKREGDDMKREIFNHRRAKELAEDLDANKGRLGNMALNQRRIDRAENLEVLLKRTEGNPDKREFEELATAVASLLSGSNTVHRESIKNLIPPENLVKGANSVAEWFFNEPRGSGQQKFAERMMGLAREEKAIAQAQIRRVQEMRLSRHEPFRRENPELYDRIVSSYLRQYEPDPNSIVGQTSGGLTGLGKQSAGGGHGAPAAPQFSDDVLQYAAKHGISPQQAQSIKQQRSGR